MHEIEIEVVAAVTDDYGRIIGHEYVRTELVDGEPICHDHFVETYED